jgi:phosphopantetheine--protein transferase-like protein
MTPLPFAGREVHVWIAEMDGETSEQVLRRVLSAYVDRQPSSWEFTVAAQGKPELCDADIGLEFNLSHSAERLAIAIADRAHPVGVDIEQVRQRPFLRLAQRYFAPAEARSLAQWQGDSLAEWFYRYWTLKEAWVKASGAGLRTPLDSFAFIFDDNGGICVQCADNVQKYDSWSIDLPGTYYLAVALAGAEKDAKLRLLSANNSGFSEPLRGELKGASRGLSISS